MITRRWLAALVVLLIATSALAAETPSTLPRYKLQKGQHLVYAGESHFKYDSGSMDSSSTTDVWVTDVQPDGSAKLLVMTSSDRGQGTADRNLLSATLSPTGHVQFDDHARPGTTLASIFPLLPSTDATAGDGWKSEPDVFGGTVQYSLLPNAPAGATVIKGINKDPEDKIYLSSRSTTYHFDTARGLVDHADTESTQGYGFHGKGTGSTHLKTVEQADPTVLKQLAADAETYFAAAETYRTATEQAEKDPKLAEKAGEADRPLKDAQAKVTNPAIKELLAAQIAQHAQYAPYIKRAAENRAAILNKPAPDFSTTDFDGNPVKLSDLRGKVVLLDFWYRGCGWCIRAMPQLKQLAEDFKGRPVAILGMNIDTKPEDAQFVIKEMSLNYPTVKAEGLPEKFKVDGFPTLLLIDQKGIIRDVETGWSPTLRKDMCDRIRSLLAEKK